MISVPLHRAPLSVGGAAGVAPTELGEPAAAEGAAPNHYQQQTDEDPNRDASTAAGQGLPDREQVPTMDTATATATPTATAYAAALVAIAALVEHGAPRPAHVSVDSSGQVVAHLAAEALPEWVIRLDLPGPDWDVETVGDVIFRRATWPPSTHDERLFRIACTDSVPVNPNAADPCRDCSDLGLAPCDPGCRR